jgi:hypothetical protein
MRIQSITYVDSLGSDTTSSELRLTFDKPFAPGFVFDLAMFRLVTADSSPVAVARIVTGPERRVADSLARERRADSLALAQRDTTAAGRARADSVERKRLADSVAAAARLAEQRRVEALRRGGRPEPVVDTLPTPVMSRPALFSEIVLVLGQRLPPGATYRLSATGLRSISGTVKPTPARSFVVPRRAPPRDTTRGRDR